MGLCSASHCSLRFCSYSKIRVRLLYSSHYGNGPARTRPAGLFNRNRVVSSYQYVWNAPIDHCHLVTVIHADSTILHMHPAYCVWIDPAPKATCVTAQRNPAFAPSGTRLCQTRECVVESPAVYHHACSTSSSTTAAIRADTGGII